jgi:Zn finger protein HypA/HybF involved in hydrogenase expression
MIKNIKPEGLQFTYFANTDLDELIRLQSQLEQFNLSMINRIKNSLDIRAILISLNLLDVNNNYLYYLYWHNGENLEALDAKVAKDTFTSKEFEYSIITREQTTKCLKCGKVWNTLVMEGDLYFGKKELRKVKEQQNSWMSCPSCGAMFRIYVVKIL